VGLERDPLNLVSTIYELLERKSNGSDPENREYDRKVGTNFADKRAVARSVQFVPRLRP
jgi:hypothetical protein